MCICCLYMCTVRPSSCPIVEARLSPIVESRRRRRISRLTWPSVKIFIIDKFTAPVRDKPLLESTADFNRTRTISDYREGSEEAANRASSARSSVQLVSSGISHAYHRRNLHRTLFSCSLRGSVRRCVRVSRRIIFPFLFAVAPS